MKKTFTKTFIIAAIINVTPTALLAQKFASPGSQACSTTTGSLTKVTAPDGVSMQPTTYTTDPCVTGTFNTVNNSPTPASNSQFCYDNSQVAASEGNPLSILIRTCDHDNCDGKAAIFKMDFTQSGGIRPKGMTFLLCDIDNGSDYITVNVYSNKVLVDYTYTFRSSPANSYARVSSGTSPSVTFDGTGSNNATATSNWTFGALDITVDPTKYVDSIVLIHTVYGNTGAQIGCPSQTFGEAAWSQNIVLPVSLVSFNAKKQVKSSVLSWTTATEINNKGFYVQHSTDAINWVNIYFVPSKNSNSNANINYSYTDENPNKNINYYRLKQVDFNGKETISKIVNLTFDISEGIFIFPNPAIDVLNIQGLNIGNNIKVINATGQVLMNKVAVLKNEIINTAKLAKGIYIITNTDFKTGKLTTVSFIK